jgi:hypothetical protein
MNKSKIIGNRNETTVHITDSIVKIIKALSLDIDRNGINVSFEKLYWTTFLLSHVHRVPPCFPAELTQGMYKIQVNPVFGLT